MQFMKYDYVSVSRSSGSCAQPLDLDTLIIRLEIDTHMTRYSIGAVSKPSDRFGFALVFRSSDQENPA